MKKWLFKWVVRHKSGERVPEVHSYYFLSPSPICDQSPKERYLAWARPSFRTCECKVCRCRWLWEKKILVVPRRSQRKRSFMEKCGDVQTMPFCRSRAPEAIDGGVEWWFVDSDGPSSGRSPRAVCFYWFWWGWSYFWASWTCDDYLDDRVPIFLPLSRTALVSTDSI